MPSPQGSDSPLTSGTVDWPHAPPHRLSEAGTYFVTAGTYRKLHHFRARQRLEVLQRGLITVCREAGWTLEAWAVFSNHYHFVAGSPCRTDSAQSLARMLGRLHSRTAAWVNRLEGTPGRKVWHNFFETKLSFERSYFARLSYVHQNAVRHGLVRTAGEYPWCSARWFEQAASKARVATIYRFKTDRLAVADDYEVESVS
jgi:putative transposase